MSILKHSVNNAYAYPIGTYSVDPSAAKTIVKGRFGKLNADSRIVLPKAGDKAWMVVFPNKLPKDGFATALGAFLVGSYTLVIDEDSFDKSKTYVPGESLYCDAEGKLTNDAGTVAGSKFVVAVVMRGKRTVHGKEVITIASKSGNATTEVVASEG